MSSVKALPENFVIANKFTQKWEKGYVNHPNDPGGVTYNGVSLRFIKDIKMDINGDGLINAEDIRTLYRNKDQAKVDEIFYEYFWKKQKLERLIYLPIQIVVYDTNVNTGVKRSTICLQRACNDFATTKLTEDGIIGPKTLECMKELSQSDNGRKLALRFCKKRMDFHNNLVSYSPYADGRDYRPFAAGWRNRVNDLSEYVLKHA